MKAAACTWPVQSERDGAGHGESILVAEVSQIEMGIPGAFAFRNRGMARVSGEYGEQAKGPKLCPSKAMSRTSVKEAA